MNVADRPLTASQIRAAICEGAFDRDLGGIIAVAQLRASLLEPPSTACRVPSVALPCQPTKGATS